VEDKLDHFADTAFQIGFRRLRHGES
jgi:hypothetical protein